GFRSLLRPDLLGLTVVTWLFFFLYGPVEAALPVYVARDVHSDARLLALEVRWSSSRRRSAPQWAGRSWARSAPRTR
ncbi:MAG TPA: hypothetical protein VKG45_17165, partial [Actinomycetes bacterium]|nr:hypothetical protein [Actinomycetes bacterium]